MENDDDDAEVLVFRGVDRPIAVPKEIVLSAQKEYRAWEAHKSGKPWDVIAAEEDYPSAAAARQAVHRYLREGRALVTEWTRSEMLAVDVARIEALLSYTWPGAEAGKIPAIAMAHNLVMSHIKTLKLDEVVDEDADKARTVIVMDDNYLDALEQAERQSKE